MIERPTSARAITQAGVEVSEAANAAPSPQSGEVPEGERVTHVLAASGPDPALVPTAPPKFADRPSPRFESTTPRPSTRRAPRKATGTEGMKYSAVFACCTEATDTPIK